MQLTDDLFQSNPLKLHPLNFLKIINILFKKKKKIKEQETLIRFTILNEKG